MTTLYKQKQEQYQWCRRCRARTEHAIQWVRYTNGSRHLCPTCTRCGHHHNPLPQHQGWEELVDPETPEGRSRKKAINEDQLSLF